VTASAASQPIPLLDLPVLPQHVGVIMDGNGRWAKAHGVDRADGHRAGAQAIRPIVERVAEYGISVLTLWGFSTENWGRPRREVQAILKLGQRFIDDYLDELHAQGVRLRHLGDLDRLPGALRSKVERAVELTSGNERLTLNLAFNYGGRADIVEAVRQLVASGVRPEDVTEEAIAAHLEAADLPAPDLVIRTGGERRISNFMIWQAAYSEYYFTETLWPDFDETELDRALLDYTKRQRRFGLIEGDPDASLDSNGQT
jgi:undecaprenyl diphosphate synthase